MCYTGWQNSHNANSGAARQFIKENRHLWQKKILNICFLDEIPAWRNDKWEHIRKQEILDIANQWRECNENVVPEFVSEEKSGDIRVTFTGMLLSNRGVYN